MPPKSHGSMSSGMSPQLEIDGANASLRQEQLLFSVSS